MDTLPVQPHPTAAPAADTVPSKAVTSPAAGQQESSKQQSTQDASDSQRSPKTPAAGAQQRKAYPGSEELMLKLLVSSSSSPQPPRASTARAKAQLSPASQKAIDASPVPAKSPSARAAAKQAAAASPQISTSPARLRTTTPARTVVLSRQPLRGRLRARHGSLPALGRDESCCPSSRVRSEENPKIEARCGVLGAGEERSAVEGDERARNGDKQIAIASQIPLAA